MDVPALDPATVLAGLDVEEKVALTAGRDAWTTRPLPRHGVPALRLADGPHGLRQPPDSDDLVSGRALPATCFPTAAALAASWDPELVEEVGEALGREARAEGVSVLLGPGANLKRTPVCGRSFEYFSEDPLLSAAMAAAWIRGVQRTGVAASLKHLAANNTERRRFGIDTYVDERALRELYLAGFERAVVEGRPATVMAAYNRLEGRHCTEHRWLLTHVLRRAWGFEGLVVSDWGAVFDRLPAVAAGCDLEMPGRDGQGDERLVRAAASGALSPTDLDASAERVLRLAATTSAAREPGHGYDADAHHALARRAAAEGAVLLRNEGGLLPLDADADVAVLGAFAAEPRYQGGGSSRVEPLRLDDALTALTERLGADRVAYAAGYRRHDEEIDAGLLDEAVRAAEGRDVAVVFVGLPEAAEVEGADRDHLRLPPSHDALVAAVAAAHPRVVVVVASGAPVEMPWRDRVAAVVQGYLGGQAGGPAVSDVLVGDREPGGRLAETFPLRWEDHPAAAVPVGPRQVEYWESLSVGYRHTETVGSDVLFPFGHGLSYTTFAWSDPQVSAEELVDGEELGVEVTVTVTNTGERPGSEVVQLYVHDVEASVFRPEHELRAFAKARLEPGESRRVRLSLDRRAFAHWDVAAGRWVVEPGAFELRLAASCRDVRAVVPVRVAGPEATGASGPARPSSVPRPVAGAGRGFDRAGFAALHGGALPDNVAEPVGAFTLDTALSDMRRSPVAAVLRLLLRRASTRALGGGDAATEQAERAVREATLRMTPLLTSGAVPPLAALGLLDLANGRWARGLRRTATGLRQGRRRR